MTDRADNTIMASAINPLEGKVIEVPSHQAVNEKKIVTASAPEKLGIATEKEGGAYDSSEIQAAPPLYDVGSHHDSDEKDTGSEDVIIITGADAAAHLLPMRDDHEPALTFRSIFLASVLSCFQAVMYQIYQVRVLASEHA